MNFNAGHYADMIKRQTSHVKDVQRSESMRLPEDLPYETYTRYQRVWYALLSLCWDVSAQVNEYLSWVSWKVGIGQTYNGKVNMLVVGS